MEARDRNYSLACTKGDIQIPELSLGAILTGSSELTVQNIVDLFRFWVSNQGQSVRQKADIATIMHMSIKSGIYY